MCGGIKDELGAKDVVSDLDIGKISVVGVGMKSRAGVAANMFEALAEAAINIHMISTSEIKISCVVSRKDAENAARVLHAAFDLARAA